MGCGSSKGASLDRHLSRILSIPRGDPIIKTYVCALQRDGYDNPEDFDGLTLLELEGDMVFKKGHVKKVRHLFSDLGCSCRTLLQSSLFSFLG